MSIQKELPKLVEANVISQSTADDILNYYSSSKQLSPNRLLVIFGTLGAILIGLGIILILAHNWDHFSRFFKTILAITPLIIGQSLCAYTLLKKKKSLAWKESSSSFLFFSIGACISLISQIYNIPGDLSSFLQTWMLLYLPVFIIMQSSMGSILYLIGISYYACNAGYLDSSQNFLYQYWIMLGGTFFFYYQLLKKEEEINSITFHNWLIPLSLSLCLGTVAQNTEELLFIAYISMFGIFNIIGNYSSFKKASLKNNGFLVVGSLGTIFVLFMLSFSWFWEELFGKVYTLKELIVSTEFYVTSILLIIAIALCFKKWKRSESNIYFREIIFALFLPIFLLGLQFSISVILINLLILGFALTTIISGNKTNHLGLLNYGLVIITILVICRFFDTDLSFVVRGLLFLTVGLGFFFMNSQLIKKRNQNG